MTDLAAEAADSAFLDTGDRSFLGHPKGLAYLAFTEAWERFSFYGMSGLLLLYMIQHLLSPAVMGGVFGLAPFRSALQGLTGPLSDLAFASQVAGLYSGFVYFTPVFGGLIADKWLGQRRTVMLGAIIMSAGHVMMATEDGFLIALLLLIIGTGLLKGNISTQVGHLYPPEHESRRTRAFTIFSAAINVGAMAGPLVCGILAQAYGWHVGFGAAGLFMLIALATYLAGAKHLPPDSRLNKQSAERVPLSGHEWRVIIVLLLIAAIGILPGTAYYQETASGLLFIEYSVARNFFGWSIPTPSFNALDGFFCIVFVPPLIAYWAWQAKRGREPGDMGKVVIGYLLTAIANLLMLWPAARADAGQTVGILWPIALFALNALGFLFYWPTLLALFSRAAPRQVNSTMMGMLFFSNFIASLLGGVLGGLWERISHANFFLLHAALAFIPFLAMLLVARPFGALLNPRVTAQ